MLPPQTFPGVFVDEIPETSREISGVATSIALFVGWAAKGPVSQATSIRSFADFERDHGGLDAASYLGYAVRQFFENGGTQAYVIRLAADGADGTRPALAASMIQAGLRVTASSPGEWGNRIEIRPLMLAGGLRLDVIDTGDDGSAEQLVESFVDLSLDPADARYLPEIVNPNSAIVRTEVDSEDLPVAAQKLVGGDNGTTLDPSMIAFRNVLERLFEAGHAIDDPGPFNLFCVPGLTDWPTIDRLLAHLAERRAFMIVDCAEAATPDTASATGVANPANLATASQAANAALFYPWVLYPDPLNPGVVSAYPPCGFAAGLLARTDSDRGVWKAAAGIQATLKGASGLKVELNDHAIELLNPWGVNCLRRTTSGTFVCWGARTLHGDISRGLDWKYIPVRRLQLFLEESLIRGTQWAVFEPNGEDLWAQLRLHIGTFLHNLFRQGAFQGSKADEAYFVRCDASTTSQADIELGRVNVLVGYAPVKQAEFSQLRLQILAGGTAI